MAELSSLLKMEEEWWMLYVDGASNVRGSGASIILEVSGDMILEQYLKFDLKLPIMKPNTRL